MAINMCVWKLQRRCRGKKDTYLPCLFRQLLDFCEVIDSLLFEAWVYGWVYACCYSDCLGDACEVR